MQEVCIAVLLVTSYSWRCQLALNDDKVFLDRVQCSALQYRTVSIYWGASILSHSIRSGVDVGVASSESGRYMTDVTRRVHAALHCMMSILLLLLIHIACAQCWHSDLATSVRSPFDNSVLHRNCSWNFSAFSIDFTCHQIFFQINRNACPKRIQVMEIQMLVTRSCTVQYISWLLPSAAVSSILYDLNENRRTSSSQSCELCCIALC